MGAAQSTDTVGGGERPEEIQYGFQVLRVDEHSPAADARLVPFFDYIISVNGVQVVTCHLFLSALIYCRFKNRPMSSVTWQEIM